MYIMLFLIVLGIAIAAYILIIHNKVMHYQQIANEHWPHIELLLKRRLGLTLHLLDAAKGSLQYEKEVITALEKIRNHIRRYGHHPDHIKNRIQAEFELSEALNKLLAAAENYPDLKANQPFLNCQKTLFSLEEELKNRSQNYNEAARELNKQMDTFPSKYIMVFFEVNNLDYFLK